MNEATLYFQQASLRLFIKPPSNQSDSDNISILRHNYNELKEDGNLKSSNSRLCWVSLGLLTYGFKDVIYDAIDNLPNTNERHGLYTKLSGQVLVELLPLPEEFKDALGLIVRRDRTQVKKWIEKYYNYLIWDENKGQFILENLEDDNVDEPKEQN